MAEQLFLVPIKILCKQKQFSIFPPTSVYNDTYTEEVIAADGSTLMVDILEKGYIAAVEKAKNDVLNDIYLYFEQTDEKPSFQDYLKRTGSHFEQIWRLAWKSKTVQRMNRHEKLRFLEKRGLSADGLSKKGINKLIEQELEGYRTFDLQDWVIDYFKQSPHLWDKLYEDVKVKKQKAYFEANVLRKSMLDSLMQARMKLYISLRADVAKHLAFELDGIPKAKLHGAKDLAGFILFGD